MTQFEKITESPEVLGAFLAALPVIDGPWDKEFHERYCADCLYLGCDACPHEEFRNNPRWWLTLETGDDQAAAEPPGIKIVFPWGESGWTSGTIGEFRFCAKVYSAPSKHGINGGRVSKLEIKKGTIPAVNYDKGWEIRPESDEVREIFRAVLGYLEALPTEEEEK